MKYIKNSLLLIWFLFFSFVHFFSYAHFRQKFIAIGIDFLGLKLNTINLLVTYVFTGLFVGLLIVIFFKILKIKLTNFNSLIVVALTIYSLLPAWFFGYTKETSYSIAMATIQIIVVYNTLVVSNILISKIAQNLMK